jgi:hypothetical protein
LRSIVASPTFQDNWSFISTGTVNIWNSYLKKPVDYVWGQVFVPLIWNAAVDNLERMKDGEGGVVEQAVVPELLPPGSATSAPAVR